MNILYTIKNNMNLSQPIEALEKFLVYLYLAERTSNKDLSLKTGLPIPIVPSFRTVFLI
ncbi:hypothetical protein [Xenorhabdus indica]|uniref:hypothetical protein n=1 Tax=Xenorhabdus indica TaxID=333964 RepID=UPI000A6F8257|nr:S-adenosylmethionine decarboxylase proenzyme [Xenorhabdus indica]